MPHLAIEARKCSCPGALTSRIKVKYCQTVHTDLPCQDGHDILSGGLELLCQNDPAVDRLISPRREVILSQLAGYIAEIELFNPALGLVGTSDRRELLIKHILDSLAPLSTLINCMGQGTGSIADVGSGAGLPGIPLAIVLPHAHITLIERMGRRANFLRNTKAALTLSNVTVEEAEMEKVRPGRFSLVTFRAFKPLEPKMLRKLLRLCVEGGTLAAYKGRREKIEAELAALDQASVNKNARFSGLNRQIIPCPVPFLNDERHIVLLMSDARTNLSQ
jgi:16S rRNA (guanine527-N7)-methyltransferase